MADFQNNTDTPISSRQTPSGDVIVNGTSYSGADIKAVVHVYDDSISRLIETKRKELEEAQDSDTQSALINELESLKRQTAEFRTKTLAEIQTLSVSVYREKYPVRALSTVYPKNYTRGPRTIAGSMVFTVFDKNVLYELLEADATEFDMDKVITGALIDQLPPFDITIAFANELGQLSRMQIYGVEFVNEGQTMSIQDLFIENTVQYVARDIDPMVGAGDLRREINRNELASSTASDLLKTNEAVELKNQLDPFKIRHDPFR